MHKQEILIKLKEVKYKNYPNSEFISKYGLYLPSYVDLKKKDLDKLRGINSQATPGRRRPASLPPGDSPGKEKGEEKGDEKMREAEAEIKERGRSREGPVRDK